MRRFLFAAVPRLAGVSLFLAVFLLVPCCRDKDNDKDSATFLTIGNQSSFVLDLISWSGYWFGQDWVWDEILQDYTWGMNPGSSDTQEVVAATAPIYFWFAAGGPLFCTDPVTVPRGKHTTFTFTDSTIVYEVTVEGAGKAIAEDLTSRSPSLEDLNQREDDHQTCIAVKGIPAPGGVPAPGGAPKY